MSEMKGNPGQESSASHRQSGVVNFRLLLEAVQNKFLRNILACASYLLEVQSGGRRTCAWLRDWNDQLVSDVKNDIHPKG
jgi:hypothetical protein